MDEHSINLPSWIVKRLVQDNGIGTKEYSYNLKGEGYGRGRDRITEYDSGPTNSRGVSLRDIEKQFGNNANVM